MLPHHKIPPEIRDGSTPTILAWDQRHRTGGRAVAVIPEGRGQIRPTRERQC